MRRKILIAAVLLLFVCFSNSVWGAGYPERSIKVMVGFPAGGPADVIGRGILPILQEKLGQGIAITNLPGAAGATAGASVVQAPPDGYTLFMGSETISVWQVMGISKDMSVQELHPHQAGFHRGACSGRAAGFQVQDGSGIFRRSQGKSRQAQDRDRGTRYRAPCLRNFGRGGARLPNLPSSPIREGLRPSSRSWAARWMRPSKWSRAWRKPTREGS